MRPGVGRVELQSVSDMLVSGDPQSVVVGVGIAVTLGDAVGKRHNVSCGAWQDRAGSGDRLEGPRTRHTQRPKLVDVAIDFQVRSLGPEISDHEAGIASDLLLNI